MTNAIKYSIGIAGIVAVILTVVYFAHKKAAVAAPALVPAVTTIKASPFNPAVLAVKAAPMAAANLVANVAPSASVTSHILTLPRATINAAELQVKAVANVAVSDVTATFGQSVNATPQDIMVANLILLNGYPKANTNYQSYVNSFNALVNTPYSLQLAISQVSPNINATNFSANSQTLYLDLVKYYFNASAGMIKNFGNVGQQNALDAQGNALAATAVGNYMRTTLAMSLVTFYMACVQESINETIVALDPIIYNPAENYLGNTPAQPKAGLQFTWERTKWQLLPNYLFNNSNTPVPCALYTYNGSLFGNDSYGYYFNDGLNCDGLAQCRGLNVYQCQSANYTNQTLVEQQNNVLNTFLNGWKTQQNYVNAQAQISNFSAALGFATFCVNAISGNYAGVAKYIINS